MSTSDPAKLITKADKLCVFLLQHFSSWFMILTTNFLFFSFFLKLIRTKLSLTRWSADWRTATQLYEQAGMNSKLQIHVQSQIQFVVYEFYIFVFVFVFLAIGFRVAKDYEKAKSAFEKASQGQEMLSSYPLWIVIFYLILILICMLFNKVVVVKS